MKKQKTGLLVGRAVPTECAADGHYGVSLMEKFRTEGVRYHDLDPLGRFAWNQGWKYPTQKAFQEAYDRFQKY